MPIAEHLDQPTAVQFVPGEGGRAVVLEKGGTARLLELSEMTKEAPPLARPKKTLLQVAVRSNSEMGLLGIAFHPNYRKNGRFFLNYNPKDGEPRTVVAEWRLVPSDLESKPATFVREILSVKQPYSNHDGGHLAFGPDGYLYIGLGDGGSAGDPESNGQNPGTLLGSMLRIDVNAPNRPYGIPADNPFVGHKGARPEVWAYGLRNPWRYSFDATGRLVAGDVGQNLYEEIDVIERGANYGWNVREATHCFLPKTGCRQQGLTPPLFEYGRDLGASVTGGLTYTGQRIASLKGRYLFADFVSGNLWSLKVDANGKSASDVRRHGSWAWNPSTFAENDEGEIVIADFTAGTLYRLDSAPK